MEKGVTLFIEEGFEEVTRLWKYGRPPVLPNHPENLGLICKEQGLFFALGLFSENLVDGSL